MFIKLATTRLLQEDLDLKPKNYPDPEHILIKCLTQNGDLAEEALVHLPLPDGGAHQDPPVAVPVNTPQLQSVADSNTWNLDPDPVMLLILKKILTKHFFFILRKNENNGNGRHFL